MSAYIKKIVATEAERQEVIRMLQQMPLDKIQYVTFGDAKRTHMQNARLHAYCSDVSKQIKFAGELRDVPTWKALFVSAHAKATGDNSEVSLGLENELVCIRESTADMGVRRMVSLLEYQKYWCAENGVRIRVPNWMLEV